MNGDTPSTAQKAINYILIWKVALTKLAIQCAITGISYYLGAMANTHWSELDGDSRVKLMLGGLLGILTLLWAFLGKVEKSMAAGDLIPPDDNGTQTWTRVQKDVTTTKQTAPSSGAPEPPPLAPTAPAPPSQGAQSP